MLDKKLQENTIPDKKMEVCEKIQHLEITLIKD